MIIPIRPDRRIGRFADRPPISPRAAIRSPGSAIFCVGAWEELGCSFRLTPRELEIVRGIFDGRKESAIAADLGCSPATVHTHIRRLYAKMAVHNHVELLVRVMAAFLAFTANLPS